MQHAMCTTAQLVPDIMLTSLLVVHRVGQQGSAKSVGGASQLVATTAVSVGAVSCAWTTTAPGSTTALATQTTKHSSCFSYVSLSLHACLAPGAEAHHASQHDCKPRGSPRPYMPSSKMGHFLRHAKPCLAVFTFSAGQCCYHLLSLWQCHVRPIYLFAAARSEKTDLNCRCERGCGACNGTAGIACHPLIEHASQQPQRGAEVRAPCHWYSQHHAVGHIAGVHLPSHKIAHTVLLLPRCRLCIGPHGLTSILLLFQPLFGPVHVW